MKRRVLIAIFTIAVAVVGGFSFPLFENRQHVVSPATSSVNKLGGFTFSYNPAQAVAGKPLEFLATVLGGSPPFTYRWNFGDGSYGAGNPVNHTYPVSIYNDSLGVTGGPPPIIYASSAQRTPATEYMASGSPLRYNSSFDDQRHYNVTLVAADAHGSSFTTSQDVFVIDALQGGPYWSYNPLSIVAGQPEKFQATLLGDFPPFTYSWQFGDGLSTIGNPVYHVFSTPGNYHGTLTITDSIGRTWTTCIGSLVLKQMVGDFSVTAIRDLQSMEAGDTATFRIDLQSAGFTGAISLIAYVSAGGGPPITYQLDGNSYGVWMGDLSHKSRNIIALTTSTPRSIVGGQFTFTIWAWAPGYATTHSTSVTLVVVPSEPAKS